jgi:integrase
VNGYLLSYDGLGSSPRGPKNVSGRVGDAFRAIGLPDFHLHSLRHYAATELIASGPDVRTVAERLGHADPALTLRVYSHVIESREGEAASVLGRALALPSPQD